MEGPIPSLFCVIPVVVVPVCCCRIEPLLAVSPIVMGVLGDRGRHHRSGGRPDRAGQIDIKRASPFSGEQLAAASFLAVGSGASDSAWRMLLIYPLAEALILLAVGTVNCQQRHRQEPHPAGRPLEARRPLMAGLPHRCRRSWWPLPPFGWLWCRWPPWWGFTCGSQAPGFADRHCADHPMV